jgi:serine protease Do
MRTKAKITFFPLITLLCLSSPVRAADPPELEQALLIERSVEKMIKAVKPSVACIYVSRSSVYAQYGGPGVNAEEGKLGGFDRDAAIRLMKGPNRERLRALVDLDLSHPDHVPASFGSGVVVDASGLILTPGHVVQRATKIHVRFASGAGSYADIVALDPRSDLAVLRLLTPPPDLKAVTMGKGEDVGQGHILIQMISTYTPGFQTGNPTASWGLVSELRRRLPDTAVETDTSRLTLHHFGTLLQTDARVQPGCSGGGLFNLRGELVALPTAHAAVPGVDSPGGFAIPLDANFRSIIEVLKRGEEVEYGFLGVEVNRDGLKGQGVVLAGVARGSPADRAGLRADDCIVSIDGQPVQGKDDLFLFIGSKLAGSSVRIEARARFTAPVRTVTAELAKFYVPTPGIVSNRPPALGGLRVDYTSILSQQAGGFQRRRYQPPEGVLVREVIRNSPADHAELQINDVITHVQGKPVPTPAAYYAAMKQAGKQAEITFVGSDQTQRRATLEIEK